MSKFCPLECGTNTENRLLTHLLGCPNKKLLKTKYYIPCVFNCSHIIKYDNLNDHYKSCPSKSIKSNNLDFQESDDDDLSIVFLKNTLKKILIESSDEEDFQPNGRKKTLDKSNVPMKLRINTIDTNNFYNLFIKE